MINLQQNDEVVIRMKVARVEDKGCFVTASEAPWLIMWIPSWQSNIINLVSNEYRNGYHDAYSDMQDGYSHESTLDEIRGQRLAEEHIAEFLGRRGIDPDIINDIVSGNYYIKGV